MREQIKKNGEYIDVILLGITANEWSNQRNQLQALVKRLKGSNEQENQ